MEIKDKYSDVDIIQYKFPMNEHHFIAVLATVKGKIKTIGRVYRELEKETGEMIYYATDSKGNQIFKDTKSLREIKRGFRKGAEPSPQKVYSKNQKSDTEKATERNEELRELRNEKENQREQDQDIIRD
jgi:hypothetical protein